MLNGRVPEKGVVEVNRILKFSEIVGPDRLDDIDPRFRWEMTQGKIDALIDWCQDLQRELDDLSNYKMKQKGRE